MAFGITERRLADVIAVPADDLCRKSRMHGRTTQAWITAFAEFMDPIVAWHGTPAAAFNWFCWHPVFPFGGRTPEEVYKADGCAPVNVWLGQIEAGVCI